MPGLGLYESALQFPLVFFFLAIASKKSGIPWFTFLIISYEDWGICLDWCDLVVYRYLRERLISVVVHSESLFRHNCWRSLPPRSNYQYSVNLNPATP